MKNVVITGTGRGIGLALTKEFANAGYQVLGTYRDEKSAKEFLDLAKQNKNILTATADVADESSFGPFKEALKKLGRVDILINNSGIIGEKANSLLETNFEKVNEVLQVNTLGPMRVTKLTMPFLAKDAIVSHISSLMGSIEDNTSGGYYDYRMSKTALNMFNMCLSHELKGKATCLVLHPGWVQTDMGGAGATTTVPDSARGLFKVLTTAKPNQTGKFFDFTGKQIPW